MNLINKGDILESYTKAKQRGINYFFSKVNINPRKRTQSTFNTTKSDGSNWWIIPAVKHRENEKLAGDPQKTFDIYLAENYLVNKHDLKLLSVACGVGNVFRSEILWACGQHPLAPVSMLARSDMQRIIATATKVLHANVYPTSAAASEQRSELAVYGRNGQRCQRCGDTIEVRRLGEQARLLYWCPGCQVHRGPRVAAMPAEQRPMDPHPAAAKFLSELPWRRRDTLAG